LSILAKFTVGYGIVFFSFNGIGCYSSSSNSITSIVGDLGDFTFFGYFFMFSKFEILLLLKSASTPEYPKIPKKYLADSSVIQVELAESVKVFKFSNFLT